MPGFVTVPEPAEVPGLVHLHTGKVRDLYRNEAGELIMVASDRVSAFDWVLPTVIPDKGRILTELSLWWFERLAHIAPGHVLSTDVPAGAPAEWAGRVTVCRPLRMAPVECVARGYLTGSVLEEYRRDRTICGVMLPEGLQDGSEIPTTIFTPSTKADVGEHDENVTYEEIARKVGAGEAAQLRQTTVALYNHARDIARERGIILADTKFEFGWAQGGGTQEGEDDALYLADEVLTPDSSRFWARDEWQPGRAQFSYDKQFIRDWLNSPESGWDRSSDTPPPELPENIVAQTRERYLEAYRLLTGHDFA
ncbi:phosphoribosylaminoimidazolesuccinocarboxamide synthase [Streptomyces spiramenti]|uniref:Phosphoribosylaminoimidazole-succinocarboxamide synthase n=1 Tax=Streptomyces spiramenti TaxID=2720606 RepID=A0ABX1ARJ4_9ACTN|nr:phosphoribosylaminoimidazolesuccinocarboxamide synthase [Streptomyces spiramenti]